MSPKVMNCPHCGRILSEEFWHEKSPREMSEAAVVCPHCGGAKTWKAAKRYTSFGVIQRYYCRSCGGRFSKA